MQIIGRTIVCLATATVLALAANPAAATPTTPNWDKAFALQTVGGVINPAVLVAFNPQPEPPAYAGDTLFSISGGVARFVVTGVSNPIGGTPQNFQFLFGAASVLGQTALTFPPDPIHDFRISFTVDVGGAAIPFDAVIDVVSTSNGVPAPGADVMFNPQPEPPALGLGDFSTLSIDFAVTSLSNVLLTVQILDATGAQLGLVPVPEPPMVALFAIALVGLEYAKRRKARVQAA